MMKRGIFLAIVLCLLFSLPQGGFASEKTDEQNLSVLQGYESFRNGDWVSALFFLRKAVGYGDATEETWYLLILSEMYSQEYDAAIQDCQHYLAQYSGGGFSPLVEYQYGRALYCSGKYQDAISQFTDFCHAYPESEFYPSSLFYIAESFFNEYNYSSAKVLYQRLLDDYPLAERAPEAQDRLRIITQAEREEKLLYLLRVTGEEYLAAKEDYEKQLRKYQSEDSMGLQDQLSKSFSDIKMMQLAVDELQHKNDEQARRIAELEEEKKLLEISAGEARRLATDIATASQNASDTTAEKEKETEVDEVVEPVVVVEEEPAEHDVGYPELDEVLKKAKELEQLLEEKSIKGEK
jgi:TolA-binding protein